MGLSRRAFLQRTGIALSALGLSDVGLSVLAKQYQQVLAHPIRRKLALLVGINQYPESVCDYVAGRGSALNGCLTDVELQRELLIHRFGFQPSDIVTLIDQQATRQAIAETFLTHLTEQVSADDVVVFHFSGLGSRVKLDANSDRVQKSLVPIDGVLPTEESPAIHDLLLETLSLLVRSLPTSRVTTILDLSYVDPTKDPTEAIQTNLRVRARPSTPSGQLNLAELTLQEQLLSQLQISRETFVNRGWGQLPGVVLAAAQDQQGAIEARWSGFSAGLFTYALTQQLWQTTPATTLRVSLGRVTERVNQITGEEQQPHASGIKKQESTAYHLTPPTTGADGVITAIDEVDKTLTLWLGGLPEAVVGYYDNAVLAVEPFDQPQGNLSLVNLSAQQSVRDTFRESDPSVVLKATFEANSTTDSETASKVALVQVRSREGLVLKARSLDPTLTMPLVGQFVRETVRVLPRNINLSVALDSTLERIERVDATSAFASISRVSTVAAAEQPVDYLFGRVAPHIQTVAALTANSEDSLSGVVPPNEVPRKEKYGLFNVGRVALPNTLIQGEEAVKTAINRLAPQLRSLLAMKLLRLITNMGSSRLGVRATLEMTSPQERLIAQQETSRAPWALPRSQSAQFLTTDGEIPRIAIGSQIRYRLHNYSDRPVYFTLLGADTRNQAIALYPVLTDTLPQIMSQNEIAPGETLLLPLVPPAPTWVINGPTGLAEAHLVFSRSPLTQCFTALDQAVGSTNTAYRVGNLPNALDVVQALLQDLHQASAVLQSNSPDEGIVPTDVASDAYQLNVDAWASLSFIYQVMA